MFLFKANSSSCALDSMPLLPAQGCCSNNIILSVLHHHFPLYWIIFITIETPYHFPQIKKTKQNLLAIDDIKDLL